MVVSNGGNYTKHIYMGSQRITSKVSNSGIFSSSPVKDTLQAKYATLTTKIKERFDTLGVTYNGVAKTGGLVSTPPLGGWGAAVYFYHSDHLGSSSLITDATGALVQHVEYVPFGETFIDERRSASSWTTPYLFNSKERDEETGLYYYHARYYDSKRSVWLSVDPLAEKYPNIGSYVYVENNPVKYVDTDGKEKHNFHKKKEPKEYYSRKFAEQYRNDNRIHIFSHGDKNGIYVYLQRNDKQVLFYINDYTEFISLMTFYTDSNLWKEYIDSGKAKEIEIVLHACSTSEFAKYLSEKFPNLIISAPDNTLVSEVNNKGRVIEKGSYRLVFENIGLYFFQRYWNTYQNGELIKTEKSNNASPSYKKNGLEQPNDLPRSSNATLQTVN